MCGKFFLTVLIFSLITSAAAQDSRNVKAAEENSFEKEMIYPIPGSDLLRHRDSEIVQFLKENPGYMEQRRLLKSAWSFNVGDPKSWLAYNFTTDQSYTVASTCRAVGVHCYIFVANDIWDTRVNQNAVDAVVNEFDYRTPADENKGIFQTCIETYGNPPDVDSDPKIIILILDIIDGFAGSGGYTAGYFWARNEVMDNFAEIYFMDADPADLLSGSGLNSALGTAAHEFQHMINWNYHQTAEELTFINEGLSKSAEIICGYGASMQSLYANETNHYLFDWRTGNATLVLNDYARAQRFFLYLMEQFGKASLMDFVQSYSTYGITGISAFDRVLNEFSTSLGRVVVNWEIANGLNDLTVHSAYGYSYSPLPLSIGTVHHNPNISPAGSTVANLGAEYFTFTNSANLSVMFSVANNDVVVKALAIGDAGSKVLDVPVNSFFNDPEYPSIYHTIRFALIDTNQYTPQDYIYQSSGTPLSTAVELKWDESEPLGYLPLPVDDIMCVAFDAFTGGKLDSIRVAFRQAGSIAGDIWEYNPSWNPSPLGIKLSSSFIASISTTPQGFPNPWTNWSTVDLSSSNILTVSPFAVAFTVPSVNNPGLMVTLKEGTDYANSFSYSSEDLRWLYYTYNDSTWQYLIRAYVSIISGGVKRVVELKPSDYSLHQNYPNPFNPSTTIRYSIPVSGLVSLKVYDITGRKIAELINEFQNPGSYEVEWDGKNESGETLPSGMYFYSIKADNFSQTRKLVLLK